MASSPDLFFVCKNCGSQVSPYITECPYCGSRIRKRAPKIERGGKVEEESRRRRRGRAGSVRAPRLGPLRTGEIPGIRGDVTRRPWVTIALVTLGALWWLALVPLREEGWEVVVNPLGEWWQVLLAPFIHANGWYQFASLAAVAIFGLALERRYGPIVALLVWLLAASGGMAVVKAVDPTPFAVGASGGALGLLCAWAVPVVLERRRHGGEDAYDDADLLGAGVIFALLALMPLAREEVSTIATFLGALIGVVCGLALARVRPR